MADCRAPFAAATLGRLPITDMLRFSGTVVQVTIGYGDDVISFNDAAVIGQAALSVNGSTVFTAVAPGLFPNSQRKLTRAAGTMVGQPWVLNAQPPWINTPVIFPDSGVLT